MWKGRRKNCGCCTVFILLPWCLVGLVGVYIPPRLIKVIIPAYLEFQHMRKSQTIRIQGAAIIINQNVLYREVQYNTDRIKDSTINDPDIWHNDWPFPSPSLISLSLSTPSRLAIGSTIQPWNRTGVINPAITPRKSAGRRRRCDIEYELLARPSCHTRTT